MMAEMLAVVKVGTRVVQWVVWLVDQLELWMVEYLAVSMDLLKAEK